MTQLQQQIPFEFSEAKPATKRSPFDREELRRMQIAFAFSGIDIFGSDNDSLPDDDLPPFDPERAEGLFNALMARQQEANQ